MFTRFNRILVAQVMVCAVNRSKPAKFC
ncbi:hypothetical protein A2U01_0109227, partial [Trifolium medium]|nr:hypothetical protein [Trifolium medium]